MRNILRGRCVLALAVAAVAVVSAVPATSLARTSKAGSTDASVQTLNVAVPLIDTPFAVVYAAQALHYYSKVGIKVNLQFVGANTVASLVAGQADVAMFGTGQSFLPVIQGKSTTVIYDFLQNGNGASVIVGANSTAQSLTDLSGKSVGVLGVGGSSYGFGQIYSNYVATHGGQAFKIVSQPTTTALIDAVASGQIDAVVGSGSWATTAIEANKAKLLLDSSKPDTVKPFLIGPVAEASIFGLTDTMKKKKETITRFLTAVVMAQRWMSKSLPITIATKVNPVAQFATIPLKTLLVSARYNKAFWPKTDGTITPTFWGTTLQNIATWNLPGVDVANPQFSFAQRVDMSYLKTAIKRADALQPTKKKK